MFEPIAREMMAFIRRSPSCFHAVQNFGELLREGGFVPLQECEPWRLEPGRGYYVTRNGSALIAFRVPRQQQGGYLIAAAHSDAPTFKLKDHPELTDEHYVRLNVEKYGGAILSPWLDRPLSVAGRVTVEEQGGLHTRLVDLARDLVLIPNLAIHMNRSVNEGVALNPQVDMLPLFGQSDAGGRLMGLVAQAAEVPEERILASDLFLYLREEGRVWGASNEFISSARLDDLQCAWACVKALLAEPEPKGLPVCAIFDNEEVGSGTKQGAGSTFLSDVLERINGSLGRSAEEHRTALASSLMVSADNGHAIHPNHPEKADKGNHPHLNGGIVVKYSANQKYTTDAVSAGLFKAICKQAGAPVQTFLNRSDVLGGSTLGNISNAHVSLNTVDIGLAQLAMHSPFETGGVRDTAYLLDGLRAFYRAGIRCQGDGRYLLD